MANVFSAYFWEQLYQASPWFYWLWIGIFAAVMGSFFNCLFYRLPRKISLRKPPSQCLSCGTVLGVLDLIPIFSWLFLKGRCRHCKTPIGARYMLVELICVIAALCGAILGDSACTSITFALLCLCFVLVLGVKNAYLHAQKVKKSPQK